MFFPSLQVINRKMSDGSALPQHALSIPVADVSDGSFDLSRGLAAQNELDLLDQDFAQVEN